MNGGIESLSSLLTNSQQEFTDSHSRRGGNQTGSNALFSNPGAIGPPKPKLKASGKAPLTTKQASRDIWDEAEVEDMEDNHYDQDPRQSPEYEISYCQRVSSEDMFLGMSGRTPSFSHTDDLQVTVNLPLASSIKEINLNVTSTLLEVATSTQYVVNCILKQDLTFFPIDS